VITLRRGERQYLHIPFWGLDGTTPEVHVGTSVAQMTAAPGYTPPASWQAPDGLAAPQWFRVLLAGPDASDNPVGTVVVPTTSRLFTRHVAGEEIDIKPDLRNDWVRIV